LKKWKRKRKESRTSIKSKEKESGNEKKISSLKSISSSSKNK
jgi:hypothetical protein